LSIDGGFTTPNPNLLNDHGVLNLIVFQGCNPYVCLGTDVSYKAEYKDGCRFARGVIAEKATECIRAAL